MLSLCDNPKFTVYTSPLCLGIAFYFSKKKNGTQLAKKKISILCKKLNITLIDGKTTKMAISNKAVHDFEDGLQYYSALNSECKSIVTYDKGDFYFSDIEVLDAEEFLLKYAVRK